MSGRFQRKPRILMIVVNFIEVITVVVIPIDVTLVGIVTDVKLPQPTKVA